MRLNTDICTVQMMDTGNDGKEKLILLAYYLALFAVCPPSFMSVFLHVRLVVSKTAFRHSVMSHLHI